MIIQVYLSANQIFIDRITKNHLIPTLRNSSNLTPSEQQRDLTKPATYLYNDRSTPSSLKAHIITRTYKKIVAKIAVRYAIVTTSYQQAPSNYPDFSIEASTSRYGIKGSTPVSL